MKKILVTGASGFIAPNLILECLKKNYKVIGIDINDKDESFPINNENYIFEKKNVFDIDKEFLSDVQYVFHLAFVTNIPNSISNPVETTKENVDMTVHLLNECTKANVKALFPQALWGITQFGMKK